MGNSRNPGPGNYTIQDKIHEGNILFLFKGPSWGFGTSERPKSMKKQNDPGTMMLFTQQVRELIIFQQLLQMFPNIY